MNHDTQFLVSWYLAHVNEEPKPAATSGTGVEFQQP
jgi:hypothetical protein